MTTTVSFHPGVDTDTFDPADLARAAVRLIEATASSNATTLIVQSAHELPERCAGNGEQIYQLLTRLLSSAMARTEGGLVAVGVQHVAGPEGSRAIRYAITDTGAGDCPQQMLACLRDQVSALGATIHGESAPGIGSCFTLEIPLR